VSFACGVWVHWNTGSPSRPEGDACPIPETPVVTKMGAQRRPAQRSPAETTYMGL
jgi:hypothetical protein